MNPFQNLGFPLVYALLGLVVWGCGDGQPARKPDLSVGIESVQQESAVRESGQLARVQGVLTHSPQDVKSLEAWLGHEFAVGETPIQATEKVPRAALMRLVGEEVEIEGTWNAGEEWNPEKLEEEEFLTQAPVFPEGVRVVRGSGIEASSVRKLKQ